MKMSILMLIVIIIKSILSSFFQHLLHFFTLLEVFFIEFLKNGVKKLDLKNLH
jgi:hypothetical protein